MYRQDLTSQSDGRIVYVPKLHMSKRRPDLELETIHAIWVEVKYRLPTLLLFNVYRSPTTPLNFCDHFNISLKRAFESNPNIIIVCDLNQNLLSSNEFHLNNITSANNLSNVISKPTRVTPYSSTLIVPVLISNSMRSMHEVTLKNDNIITK